MRRVSSGDAISLRATGSARGARRLPRAYTLIGATSIVVRARRRRAPTRSTSSTRSACRRWVDRPHNWLLAKHPDAYLFGTLAEAELYIGHDERAPLWLQRREAASPRSSKPTAKPAGAAVADPGGRYLDRNQHHRGRDRRVGRCDGAGQAGFITVGDTPPLNPREGDGWWDSVGAQLYVWYDDGTSAAWVPATNTSGTAISSLRTEAPTSGAVIVMTAADQALAITSGALGGLDDPSAAGSGSGSSGRAVVC